MPQDPEVLKTYLFLQEAKMKLPSKYKRSTCHKRIDISVALRKRPINSRSRPYTVIKAAPSFPVIKSITIPMSGLKITGNNTGCRTVCFTERYGVKVKPIMVFVQTYAQ